MRLRHKRQSKCRVGPRPASMLSPRPGPVALGSFRPHTAAHGSQQLLGSGGGNNALTLWQRRWQQRPQRLLRATANSRVCYCWPQLEGSAWQQGGGEQHLGADGYVCVLLKRAASRDVDGTTSQACQGHSYFCTICLFFYLFVFMRAKIMRRAKCATTYFTANCLPSAFSVRRLTVGRHALASTQHPTSAEDHRL